MHASIQLLFPACTARFVPPLWMQDTCRSPSLGLRGACQPWPCLAMEPTSGTEGQILGRTRVWASIMTETAMEVPVTRNGERRVAHQ